MSSKEQQEEIVQRRLEHLIDEVDFWAKEWEACGDNKALEFLQWVIQRRDEYARIKYDLETRELFTSYPINCGPVTFKPAGVDFPKY